MKPDAKNLRIRLFSRNPNCKAGAVTARKLTNEKNKQLAAAVDWCLQHNVRGYSALNTGQFPLINDRKTVNRRLDKKVINGKEREYCSILTDKDELSIVSYAKKQKQSYARR